MKNNEKKAEVLQISIYCDIIKVLLEKHSELSMSKLLVYSYLAKKEGTFPEKVYNAKVKKDIVYKSIALMSGEYSNFCNCCKYIIGAIHLLILSKQIELKNTYLIKSEKSVSNIFKESKFLYNAIEESKKMNDKQFMREVINNV